ncbi:MAG: NAD(P)-binding domain-containing protein, partial [Paracoccaceae bacterium]|nr:NAD(P)-binding domain-containing protein [Paracoccaceae bacterium]
MKHHVISGVPMHSHARPYNRVTVIGAGSWGTALGVTLARAGCTTLLYGRDPAVIDEINTLATTERFLPGVALPKALVGVKNMPFALKKAEAVLIVVPSRSVRTVARQVAQHAPKGIPIAICAKGIEPETGLLMTQVAEEELGDHPIGCVSGPTFALETALGHPTAATVAFPFTYADRLKPQDSPAVRLAVSLSTESFRAYVSDDLVGVEIGGAVKNIIAIACGLMTGAGFAENTRAAL